MIEKIDMLLKSRKKLSRAKIDQFIDNKLMPVLYSVSEEDLKKVLGEFNLIFNWRIYEVYKK